MAIARLRHHLGVWRGQVRDLGQFLYRQRIAGFDVPGAPLLDPIATEAFNRLIRQSNCYLEFGAGGTTLIADALNIPALTVEADRFYARTVRAALKPSSSVEIMEVDIGPTGQWSVPFFQSPTRNRLRRWRRYIAQPFLRLKELDCFPDFVLVDGRFRRACMLSAAATTVYNGRAITMMVDDYFKPDRDHYHQVEKWFGSPKREGRAAVFAVVASSLRLPIERKHIDEAVRDWR